MPKGKNTKATMDSDKVQSCKRYFSVSFPLGSRGKQCFNVKIAHGCGQVGTVITLVKFHVNRKSYF